MNKILWPACLIAAVAMIACQTGATTTPSSRTVEPTLSKTDAQSIQRGLASYQSHVAQGEVYSFSGHLSDINVSSVNGKTHVFGHAAPGDYLDVSFVKGTHPIFNLTNSGE